MSTAVPHIRAGTLRGLAVTSKVRVPSLPEVPTVDEADMPGQYAETFQGLFVPMGTPPAVIASLHAETVKAFASPEVRERMVAIGLEILASSPREFTAQIKSEIPRWKKIITGAKIKVD